MNESAFYHSATFLVALFLVAVPAKADTITNPIPMSGSGSWYAGCYNTGDTWPDCGGTLGKMSPYGYSGGTVSASGSTGTDTVFFTYTFGCGPVGAFVDYTFGDTCGLYALSYATVDGTESYNYSVSLAGDGIGVLDLYDETTGNLIASADLAGGIGGETPGGPAPGEFSGDFSISPVETPEPIATILLGSGLTVLGLWGACRQRRRRAAPALALNR